MFHQGTVNDNKFMSEDATQVNFVCADLEIQHYSNKLSVLLSMNKSARRCLFCNESVKHDKSVGLTHFRVKTDIKLIISLVFSV